MFESPDLIGKALTEADFEDLAALAEACFRADGGLPHAVQPWFLRRRWTGEGAVAVAVRDARGTLVGAGSVRPGSAGGERMVTLLVAPARRAAGSEDLAGRLLDWALAQAGQREHGEALVTVESESVTPAVEELFASRGLRQVFAEDVMRFDLAEGVPEAVWPVGTALLEWDAGREQRFFEVFEASFRERPGYPGWTAKEWIQSVVDDDFRPSWSVLASIPDLGDAGFVTAAVGWIVQVGVVPRARGRGLGAALIRESLHRMREAGGIEAWLTVNVDNTAKRLYASLGFAERGRRARYRFADDGRRRPSA